MAQAKLWAFHGEADRPAELIAVMEKALADLKGTAGGGGGATAAPTGKGKAAAPAPTPAPESKPAAPAPAPGGAKHTLADVKNALTALKTAIDDKEGEAKKLGIKAVKAVLKKFGVTESPALTEDQYGPILAAIAEAMPEGESPDGEEF